jgi:hypothetical protein
MATTLGIAAFILSLVAIPIPFFGIMVGWAALLLACLAALYGDKVLTIAVVFISVIDYVFFSPSLLLSALAPGESRLIQITMVMVAAPVAALFLAQLLRSGRNY